MTTPMSPSTWHTIRLAVLCDVLGWHNTFMFIDTVTGRCAEVCRRCHREVRDLGC